MTHDHFSPSPISAAHPYRPGPLHRSACRAPRAAPARRAKEKWSEPRPAPNPRRPGRWWQVNGELKIKGTRQVTDVRQLHLAWSAKSRPSHEPTRVIMEAPRRLGQYGQTSYVSLPASAAAYDVKSVRKRPYSISIRASKSEIWQRTRRVSGGCILAGGPNSKKKIELTCLAQQVQTSFKMLSA